MVGTGTQVSKFKVTFKTPDAREYVIRAFQLDLPYDDGSDEEYEATEDFKGFLARFVKYSEYITVEFDYDNKTAKIVENKHA